MYNLHLRERQKAMCKQAWDKLNNMQERNNTALNETDTRQETTMLKDESAIKTPTHGQHEPMLTNA